MSAAGLAENDHPADDAPATLPFGVSATGGLDYASAFYFRGYLQADSGFVLQPNLTLFANCPAENGPVVRPYVSLFNSSGFGGDDPMRQMSDVMAGATSTWGSLTLDARYAYYTPRPAMRLPEHELGLKASYDVASVWAEPEGPFALRVFAGVYAGLSARGDDGRLYLEPGLEPAWRLPLAGQVVGIGLPVLVGLSGDAYYLNARGDNSPLGYLSSAVTGSVSLPAPAGCGRWFLNASLQYLYLFADDLRARNDGRSSVFIGKVGVGFLY